MKYRRILVDGRHLLYRTASVLEGLKADAGVEEIDTGAVHGFLRVILSVIDEWAADDTWVCVCWEGGYDHRRALYPDYKKNRRDDITDEKREMLASLAAQQSILQELLSLAGWPQAFAPGYEADDTIATLAAHLDGREGKLAIYTGDHDMHQCVTDGIHVLCPPSPASGQRNGNKVWSADDVRQKWAVEPARVPEHKALAGDASDNIPGVSGIGIIWAKKLLNAYPDLDSLVAAAKLGELSGTWDGAPWRSTSVPMKIINDEAMLRTSYCLATVVKNAPVTFWPRSPNRVGLLELYKRYHFVQLSRPQLVNQMLLIGAARPG